MKLKGPMRGLLPRAWCLRYCAISASTEQGCDISAITPIGAFGADACALSGCATAEPAINKNRWRYELLPVRADW